MPLCKKNSVLVIVGPTATGKSALALTVAERVAAEIISGDSMLVYRGFDIGTAKPTAAERQSVPHHLIDCKEPTEKYSAAEFQADATRLIVEINARGHLPIVVGGTGLYIKALAEGYDFLPATPHNGFRAEMEQVLKTEGVAGLYKRLSEANPAAAEKIDRQNPRRLVRALEAAYFGETAEKKKRGLPPDFQLTVAGMNLPRPLLYERINKRVDKMLAAGLIDEIKKLLAGGVPRDAPAMQGIGYKELLTYLDGQTDLNTATEELKAATRHFAKRQLTWYKKMPYIVWLDAEKSLDELADCVSALLKQK